MASKSWWEKGKLAIEHIEACYEIDGVGYPSLACIYGAAKIRGYTGTMLGIRYRIKHGAATWDSLLKPLQKHKNHSQATKKGIKKKRDECAEIMARVDARKKEIEEENT